MWARGLLLLAVLAVSPSVRPELRRHSADALRADWGALRAALETYHPGLYGFTSPAEYEAFFEQVHEDIGSGLSDLDFFRHVARAVEMTHERHTRVGLWTDDRGSDVVNVFRDGARLLPLDVVLVDDQVFIARNGSADDALVPGTRLLAIDGRPIEEVIGSLHPYVVADGYNGVSKNRDIERTLRFLYFWFVDRPERFQLEVALPGATPSLVEIDALSTTEIATNAERREPATPIEAKPAYTFTQDESTKSAVLALTTFSREGYGANGTPARKVFARVFRDLRDSGTRTLILDLRGNSGGRIAYVREFVPFMLRAPRSGLLYSATSYEGRTKRYRIPRPHPLAFRGRWIVLVDAGTWSAGAQLASFAREFAAAIVVGEETGGRYDGNSGGSHQKMTLPNTAIAVWIPRWIFKFAVAEAPFGRGLLPDHRRLPTLADRLSGADPVLEFARQLAL